MFKAANILLANSYSEGGTTLANRVVLSMRLNKTSFFNDVFSVCFYNEYPDTS